MGLEDKELEGFSSELRRFIVRGRRLLKERETELLVGIANDVADKGMKYYPDRHY